MHDGTACKQIQYAVVVNFFILDFRDVFWFGPPAPKVLGSDKNSKNSSGLQLLRHFEKGGGVFDWLVTGGGVGCVGDGRVEGWGHGVEAPGRAPVHVAVVPHAVQDAHITVAPELGPVPNGSAALPWVGGETGRLRLLHFGAPIFTHLV